jgi:hypothetical protein
MKISVCQPVDPLQRRLADIEPRKGEDVVLALRSADYSHQSAAEHRERVHSMASRRAPGNQLCSLAASPAEGHAATPLCVGLSHKQLAQLKVYMCMARRDRSRARGPTRGSSGWGLGVLLCGCSVPGARGSRLSMQFASTHLHRDWAHPCHVCTGTGELGRAPRPSSHQDREGRVSLCAQLLLACVPGSSMRCSEPIGRPAKTAPGPRFDQRGNCSDSAGRPEALQVARVPRRAA